MKERPGILWKAATIVLAVALVAGGIYWHRRGGQLGLNGSEMKELRQQLEDSEARAAALEQQLNGLRAQFAAAEEALGTDGRTAGVQRRLDPAAVAALQAQLAREWQTKLSAVETALDQTKAAVADLENSVEAAKTENLRLEQGRKELEEQLTITKRIVAAMEQELKGKSDRLASIEVAANQSQEKRREAERQLADLHTALQQLEEINRRRDVYLNTVFRRYREMTDLYRTTISRFDRSSDTAAIASNDLSRIQDAIALTEEDLRQLGALNTRANQVLRRLDRKP